MDINVEKIAQDAGNNYEKGGFFCSESIIHSFNDNLDMGLSDMAIKMSSGFPVGIGGSKCLCGAVAGGSMVLSAFFGRTEVPEGKDPEAIKCLKLNKELVQNFKERNKVTCCGILTKNMDFKTGEHKKQCIEFTKDVARDVATILSREL